MSAAEHEPRAPHLEAGAARRRAQGVCAVVKVKVGGNGSIAEQAARVRAIADQAASSLRLRLDANQCWSLSQAVEFAAALGKDVLGVIDYIEEPLRDASQLPAFYDQTGMRYALDETLAAMARPAAAPGPADAAFEAAIKSKGLAALVLKPTLLGGFARCLALHSRAPAGTEAVTSAAFESGLLVSHMAILTAALFGAAAGRTPHGLSTYERLEQDLLTPALARQVHGRRMSVARCERAVAKLVRTLESNSLVSRPLGREEAPPLQGPNSAEDDDSAAMMARFGGAF